LQIFNSAYDAHGLRVWQQRSSNFKRKEASRMKMIPGQVLIAAV
jgi:hypothetical protein